MAEVNLLGEQHLKKARGLAVNRKSMNKAAMEGMEAEARRYLTAHPDAEPVICELAQVLRYLGREDEAIALLQNTPISARNEASYCIEAEIFNKVKGQPAEALKRLEACPMERRNEFFYFIKADISWKEGRAADEVLKALNTCPADKADAAIHALKAEVLWKGKNDVEGALAVLQSCPEARRDSKVYALRGEILWKEKNAEEALAALEECPPEKRRANLHNLRTKILWRGKNMLPLALAQMVSTPGAEKNAECFSLLAEMQWESGQRTQAYETLSYMMQRYPQIPETSLLKARFTLEEGRVAQTKEYMGMYLKLHPTSHQGWAVMAQVGAVELTLAKNKAQQSESIALLAQCFDAIKSVPPTIKTMRMLKALVLAGVTPEPYQQLLAMLPVIAPNAIKPAQLAELTIGPKEKRVDIEKVKPGSEAIKVACNHIKRCSVMAQNSYPNITPRMMGGVGV